MADIMRPYIKAHSSVYGSVSHYFMMSGLITCVMGEHKEPCGKLPFSSLAEAPVA